MSSLADYLAKNYLTADPPGQPKKKRKKAKHAELSGLIIADDDPPSLRGPAADRSHPDEDSPYVVDTSRPTADFRRKKVSNWKTVGAEAAAAASAAGSNVEQAAADAIIAAAVTERRNADESEDAPVVTEARDDDSDGDDYNNDAAASLPRMESGARAGLQTAEQTAAMVAAEERRRKADAKAYHTSGSGSKDPAATVQQETIYRDASGRIINVTMKRAEARRAAEEQRLKEEQAQAALMGDVQRQERESRKQELREAQYLPLARTADDEVMNEELKARQRWNDPAAQFLSTPKTAGGVNADAAGRPIYKGSYQPNRYSIRPGHRWDGVDRSTSFEKEWFAARQKKARVGALEYEWQMDE